MKRLWEKSFKKALKQLIIRFHIDSLSYLLAGDVDLDRAIERMRPTPVEDGNLTCATQQIQDFKISIHQISHISVFQISRFQDFKIFSFQDKLYVYYLCGRHNDLAREFHGDDRDAFLQVSVALVVRDNLLTRALIPDPIQHVAYTAVNVELHVAM